MNPENAAQLKLFEPQEEAIFYHNSLQHGFFSLLVAKSERGAKKQNSFLLSQMAEVLSLVDPRFDTWLSQAEFMKPNRRVVNLLRVGLLFADLDTYRESWAIGRTPDELADAVLYFCREEGIPLPSILVYSGRGIQAKWLLVGTLPRQVLPRWNACQRYLVDRLNYLGADPAAKDASRVLRLVKTVNTKSGEICRVVHVEAGADGQPIRYDFEALCEILLPMTRQQLAEQREAYAARLELIKGGKKGKLENLRSFSGRQLAWDRLEDLRLLAKLRGGVQKGERMWHLFWQLNFLCLSGAVHSAKLYNEAAALAHEIDPQWGYRSAELMTLYAKAKAYEAGERIEYAGKQYAPLYTPRNDTLISFLKITDEEQRQLRTIISKDIATERRRQRDRERDEQRRRANGAVDRHTYEVQSLNNLKPWESLGMSRRSWYRQGKPSVNNT